jgi:hypothetical protein
MSDTLKILVRRTHEMLQNVGRKMSGESRGVYLFVHEHVESQNLTTSTI